MKRISVFFAIIAMIVFLCACGGPKEVTDMQYTATIWGEEYSGVFTGTIVDGIPNGEGIFNYTSDRGYIKYAGFWTDGAFSDKGYLESDLYVVHFLDGINRIGEYKGSLVDGLACGEGTFSALNDEGVRYSYTGEWSGGLFNGFGKTVFDDDSIMVQEGNYKDGEFTPTPAQLFSALGTGENGYAIIPNASSLLEKFPDVFKTNSIYGTDIKIDSSFKYEAFAKNPQKFGNKLIKVYGLNVVQIFEDSLWGYDVTFCLAEDSNYNMYYIYLLGYADNVYEGSNVTLTALPLDFFTYQSVLGHEVWAIACAAVSIE